MNLTLKAVYYYSTNSSRWGKGFTIAEAKKNAGLTSKSAEKNCQFSVLAAIFNNPTEDELKNLFACITFDSIGGSAKYYDGDRTEEDTEMINRLHVGWLTVEKNY